MKAIIPREQEIAIYDYIYLILLVEVLEGKSKKGLNLDSFISKVLEELAVIKSYLRNNKIKIHPVKVDPDGLFVQYDFSCKVDGGYKQGNFRFWRAAIQMVLKKKLKLLQNGEKITESEFTV